MVETPFALKKFILASHIAFPGDLRTNVQRLINVETITTIRNLDDMLAIPEAKDLNGIVIGRVDLTGSLGLSREQINSQQILDLSLAAAAKAKAKGLDVVVGGGVSAHSRDFFKAFPPGHLDRYETRKVIFQCPGALSNPEAAFLKAVEFELYWLKNKKAYYGTIFGEDDARIEMLEKRYRQSINATK